MAEENEYIKILIWKQPKYPLMDERIQKMCYVCVYIHICAHTQWKLLGHKKMKSCMVGPWGDYVDTSEAEKDKYPVISHICGI